MQIVRASHAYYLSKFTDYHFPNNLSKAQMINKIEEWKNFITSNDAIIYFDELINYLNGNSNVCGIEGQIKQKRKEWGNVANKNLNKLGILLHLLIMICFHKLI
jgi:hypothetical protein